MNTSTGSESYADGRRTQNGLVQMRESYSGRFRLEIETGIRKVLENALALLAYRNTFSNYPSVILHVVTRKYPFLGVVKRTQHKITIPTHFLAYEIARGLIDVDYHPETGLVSVGLNNKRYFFSGALDNGDLAGVFAHQAYSSLCVSDQNVIDVGTNIGDSAIYFAALGARHVYALEPFPSSFAQAKKNVEINNLREKITVINAGLSEVDGEITIDPRFKNSPTHPMTSFRSGTRVPVFSLRTLISSLGINDGVLKMDCEGFEYPTILSSSAEVLQTFRRVQIEYHYGSDKLVGKLRESGFTVSSTLQRPAFNKHLSNPRLSVGYIFASRNNAKTGE